MAATLTFRDDSTMLPPEAEVWMRAFAAALSHPAPVVTLAASTADAAVAEYRKRVDATRAAEVARAKPV